ncbi:hypothetical protein OK074_4610 [Actinobacteria bacterium OK074]|nr:hypothetical protein OK074_4610 [Actinobacteria bacterium OK074]
MVRPVPAHEAIRLLRTMTWVLCAVGLLTLIFTTVNVTRFATTRDVPLPIAVLLDPMIGTALAGVLYVDARLASWGISPPAWSTTLRWGAGCTAALMNTWESLWPDGRIGFPHRADPAAVLLHLTPALLLIALTETIAAYRRCVTDLLEGAGSADPAKPSPGSPALPTEPADSNTALPDLLNASAAEGDFAYEPAPTAPLTVGRSERPKRGTRNDTPHNQCRAPTPPLTDDGASDGDVWPRAVALNDAARATTGKPVSIWRLRTDLRVGPRRARRIHDRLLSQATDPPAPPD